MQTQPEYMITKRMVWLLLMLAASIAIIAFCEWGGECIIVVSFGFAITIFCLVFAEKKESDNNEQDYL